jgi:hypothetical protein
VTALPGAGLSRERFEFHNLRIARDARENAARLEGFE